MNIEIIEWLEACKYKSPISEEQECRLGPKRSPGITEEDPQEQWEFKGLGSNGHTRVKKSLVMAKFMKTAATGIFKTIPIVLTPSLEGL